MVHEWADEGSPAGADGAHICKCLSSADQHLLPSGGISVQYTKW